jgi:uncharacterized protein YukE
MESMQGPAHFSPYLLQQEVEFEEVPAVSFEHAEALVPLTERTTAELIAASACQTGLSRQIFWSAFVILKHFRIFTCEQDLRTHPDVQQTWLPRFVDLMHGIRQTLQDFNFVSGQKEKKLRALAAGLEEFNKDCLNLAQNILSGSSFNDLFQSAHSISTEDERKERSARLKDQIAELSSGIKSLSEGGDGKSRKALVDKNRSLRKRVRSLEEELRETCANLREAEESKQAEAKEKVDLQRVGDATPLISYFLIFEIDFDAN